MAVGLALLVMLGATLLWSRADRPSRLIVTWSLDETFRKARKIVGPYAMDDTDFTVRQDLVGLPAGQDVFVRVEFQGLDNGRAMSEPVLGRLTGSAIRFTAGIVRYEGRVDGENLAGEIKAATPRAFAADESHGAAAPFEPCSSIVGKGLDLVAVNGVEIDVAVKDFVGQ